MKRHGASRRPQREITALCKKKTDSLVRVGFFVCIFQLSVRLRHSIS